MSRTRELLLLAALLAVGGGLFLWFSKGGPVSANLVPSPEGLPDDLPEIGLARTGVAPGPVGRRDIFRFGPPPEASRPERPRPVLVLAPPPSPVEAAAPPVTMLPALNLRYIGTVENEQGLKVAVLLTEQREILAGKAGDVVANRYRIVHIGLESVDILETTSARVQRIPLKGN